MDFRNRGAQSQVPQAQSPSQPANSTGGYNQGNKPGNKSKWFDRGESLLLVGGALLVAAIAFLLYTGSPSQNKAVQTDKYQAVFLNNGQVYFGKIKALDSEFIDLQGIYYLQTNGTEGEQATAANNNVSLVKLGCELHAPYDQMVINNDQVIFWENLQDGGQVVKAINEYKKQNPKGQTCSNESQNSTQQAPATNTTGTGNATTPAPAPTQTQQAPATAPKTNTRP